jgi:hypothetical protein
MIKGLFFTVALLAPGLAYGGNPSGDLSVEVVPASPNGIACDIGPAYTGAVPAAAQAAGFTRCAANYDFSNSFYAARSNWLDCAGAANPQWWNLSYSGGAVAPCSRFNIIADPAFGTNALQSIYLPSDWPNELATELDTTNSSSPRPGTNPGFFFATQFYAEVAEYVTANAQNNAYTRTTCGTSPAQLGSGLWTWAAPNTVETDFMEFYPGLNKCGNGGNTIDWNDGAYSTGAALTLGNNGGQPGQQAGYDPTIPHTYGVLQTASGTTYTRCNYMDGTQLGSACFSAAFGSAVLSSKSWMKMSMGPHTNSASTQPAVNVDLRVQRVTIWECPSYQTGHC